MKRAILIGIAIVFCVHPVAHAYSVLNFSWTGQIAEKNDLLGYIDAAATSYIGGAAAANVDGYALQFTFAEKTFVKNVIADIDVKPWHPLTTESIDFWFSFYSGTTFRPFDPTDPVPDATTEVGKSSTIYLSSNWDAVKSYPGYATSDFNLVFDPGTYWLAYEEPWADSGPAMAWVNNIRFEGYAVPEPASLLMFGVGALALAGYGRRRMIKSA
jgi:hypothetical protein